ncbi:hypothetical protein RF55_22593 [Lasius niger]|uniref:Uncharacterized protein n=1 Tax=Lasius niger TaxID=67767 RepID=A0A0J7JWS9_LASNI|nr:hypothetical protein RF55_22593 [Lasius niger]
MEEVCLICCQSLSSGNTVVVERGIDTLRDASVERNDGKIGHLRRVNSIKIHVQCRKEYTRKSSIAATKRKQDEGASTSGSSPPRTRRHTNEYLFDFQNLCIFCGEEKEKKKDIKSRRIIHRVSTATFKDSIIAVAEQLGNDMAKAVTKRIIYEDLVAAEARYHHDCHVSFKKPTTGGKIGRPQDSRITSAMEKIYTYIENNDDCQFTLAELKDVCKDFTPDEKTIKSKLIERYEEKIVITTKNRSLTIICFIDVQHDLLSKAWYEKKNRTKRKNVSEF